MLDKKQILAIFLFKFKMGHKAVETLHNINNTFGPGTANNVQCNGGSRSFEKETRALKMRNTVVSHQFSSVHFSSLQLLSHVRLFVTPWTKACQAHCLSPTPGDYSDSCPLSWWCHPIISSSAIPFSSCLQCFPASESFQMSQLFASGGQSIGVSASASVLPMNTQDWSLFGWTGWISLQSKGLSRIFSHTTVQKHQFFSCQPSEVDNGQLRGLSELILLTTGEVEELNVSHSTDI